MEISNNITKQHTGEDYLYATGKIPYGMTNDYIFRIVFQTNKYALKGLLCSILGLRDDEIVDLEITNEIVPGKSITDKEYRMDIVVSLNNRETINLEMQINNYNNWQCRSLSYLCRNYDTLIHGEDYNDVKKAYQIGFLDFTLFEDHPEFFAKYQMRNIKDSHLYTDTFNLIVVSLNQIELATDEDKAHDIDKWARLFKSKTWEELKMVAKDNDYMTSAVETVFLSNENKEIAKIARERDDFLRYQAQREEKIKKLEEENLEQANTIAEKENLLTEQAQEIARLKAELRANNKQPGNSVKV